MQQNLFWASNQRGFSIGVDCLQNHRRAKEKARNKDTTGVDALTGPGTHVGCGLSPVADSSACAALFTNKRTLRVIVWVLERKKGGVPCRTTASCALEGMVHWYTWYSSTGLSLFTWETSIHPWRHSQGSCGLSSSYWLVPPSMGTPMGEGVVLIAGPAVPSHDFMGSYRWPFHAVPSARNK